MYVNQVACDVVWFSSLSRNILLCLTSCADTQHTADTLHFLILLSTVSPDTLRGDSFLLVGCTRSVALFPGSPPLLRNLRTARHQKARTVKGGSSTSPLLILLSLNWVRTASLQRLHGHVSILLPSILSCILSILPSLVGAHT